jgi:hypothetical protein
MQLFSLLALIPLVASVALPVPEPAVNVDKQLQARGGATAPLPVPRPSPKGPRPYYEDSSYRRIEFKARAYDKTAPETGGDIPHGPCCAREAVSPTLSEIPGLHDIKREDLKAIPDAWGKRGEGISPCPTLDSWGKRGEAISPDELPHKGWKKMQEGGSGEVGVQAWAERGDGEAEPEAWVETEGAQVEPEAWGKRGDGEVEPQAWEKRQVIITPPSAPEPRGEPSKDGKAVHGWNNGEEGDEIGIQAWGK